MVENHVHPIYTCTVFGQVSKMSGHTQCNFSSVSVHVRTPRGARLHLVRTPRDTSLLLLASANPSGHARNTNPPASRVRKSVQTCMEHESHCQSSPCTPMPCMDTTLSFNSKSIFNKSDYFSLSLYTFFLRGLQGVFFRMFSWCSLSLIYNLILKKIKL